MKILLTGASGFLGSVLKEELAKKNEVITLGRRSDNAISLNLKEQVPELPEVDVIIHAAGKAHVVPQSEREKKDFFQVNETGTRNLLKGIKSIPKALIFISTVAVYGKEIGEDIDESYPLNGQSPYAKSKILAEKLVEEFGQKSGCKTLILRLPLIVGKNAPGNLGAISKAIQKGYYFRLGDGSARKSMVLAKDVAHLIDTWNGKEGVYNLSDGAHPSLADLDSYLAMKYGKKVRSIPAGFLSIVAKFGDMIPGFPLNTYRLNKLKGSLIFSDQKARENLNWRPRKVIGNF